MENTNCNCLENIINKVNLVQDFINEKLLDITEAECSRMNNENERIKNETARQKAECDRITNENVRQEGYNKIVELIDKYTESEKGILLNELERINNENKRLLYEKYRNDAENIRKELENSRQTAETLRTTSEINRIENESSRVIAEDKRNIAELNRQQSELIRETQESTRQDNELIRKNLENSRVQAEIARIEAEKTRETNCATAVANANEVASNPIYVGKDNYVYQYDRTLKTYVKTLIYVKGDKGDTGINLNMISITWNELKSLRDSGKLQTGLQYRITDYQCTTSQTDTISAGHLFDIIVMALSSSILSEKALAVLHDKDTYFINSKLQSWLLWYCLDNDTTRFEWADTTNGKGVIYRMIDEFGNDCPYDFKNIQFKRYNITGVKNSKSLYVGIGTYLGIKSDLLTINSDSYIWAYTFCGIPLQSSEDASKYEDDDIPKLDTSNPIDLSLNLYSSYYKYTDFYNCYNNKISTTKKVSLEEKLTVNIPITLPDIVFLSLTIVLETRPKNYFVMYGFHDNVLEGHCEHISIGDRSCYNTFKGFTEYCVFVLSFLNNILTGTLNNNIFADIIEYNSFSGNIENNVFNALMRSNKFIGHCYNNYFTSLILILNCIINDLGYNTFNNSILYSTFTDVTSCTFKSSINHCLFEGDCYGCIFPEDSDKSLLYIRLCGEILGYGLATITVTLDSKKELIITLDSIADDSSAP